MKKPRKPKLISLSAMTKELDTIWSQVVRNRDGRCILCGCTGNLQAHHLITRKISVTRHDLENGVALCYTCHLFKVHKDTVRYALLLINAIGKDRWNRIKAKAESPALNSELTNMSKPKKMEYYEKVRLSLTMPTGNILANGDLHFYSPNGYLKKNSNGITIVDKKGTISIGIPRVKRQSNLNINSVSQEITFYNDNTKIGQIIEL